MPITVTQGVHGTYADDSVLNGFPNVQPAMNQFGIATQELTVLETQKYNIDIQNDFKNFAPKETPLITILGNLGGGVLDRDFDTWTNSYDGVDHPSVMVDHLRVRDVLGDESAYTYAGAGTGTYGENKPIPVGDAGYIGGKLFFQYAMISTDSATTWTADFTGVNDNIALYVKTPTGKTDATLYPSEIKDLAPVANASGQLLLTLGFSRTQSYTAGSTADYINMTQGRVSEFIRLMQNALQLNDYVITKYTGITINGTTGKTIYDVKYVANQSKRAMWKWTNLYGGELNTTHTSCATKNNIGTSIGIERFIFSTDGTTFVIVLDMAHSNLDFVLGTEYNLETNMDGAHTLIANRKYLQVTKILNAAKDVMPVGTILYDNSVGVYDRAANNRIAYNDSNYLVQPVRTMFLFETVNTATKITCGAISAAARPFAMNEGSSYANVGGWSVPSPHICINMYDDLVEPAADFDPFDTVTTGNVVRGNAQYHNWFELHKDKPYAVSVMRLNTGIRFGDTVQITRQRKFKQFKKGFENSFMYGTASNMSPSVENYKGTTAGFFDYSMYQINYIKHPCPIDSAGTVTYAENVRGLAFKNWIDDLCKAVMISETKTFLVGQDFINLIETNMAIIASGRDKPNILGYTNFEKVPVGKATFGLQVYEYQSPYGIARFTHMPNLDLMTSFRVPTHLFASGRRSPRWAAIAIEKTDLNVLTRKGYEDKLHGNLQANDQRFVSIEAYSGGHMFKMRNPANQWFIDMTPNI